MSDHKPIICQRCKLRIHDAGELTAPAIGQEGLYVGQEQVCSCDYRQGNSFTSPQPRNLDWYDKNST